MEEEYEALLMSETETVCVSAVYSETTISVLFKAAGFQTFSSLELLKNMYNNLKDLRIISWISWISVSGSVFKYVQ